MGERREYSLKLTVNGRIFRRVIIDDHFEDRHSATVDDFLILRLVMLLDGRVFSPEVTASDGYSYYREDPVWLNKKPYRIVWTSHPEEDFLGIVNVFRRPYAKED